MEDMSRCHREKRNLRKASRVPQIRATGKVQRILIASGRSPRGILRYIEITNMKLMFTLLKETEDSF